MKVALSAKSSLPQSCTFPPLTPLQIVVTIDMRFEWDEVKRRANIGKHGIDFVDAPQVFADAFVVMEDVRFDYGESRFLALGLLHGIVVVVAYATAVGAVTRVISMSTRTSHEAAMNFD